MARRYQPAPWLSLNPNFNSVGTISDRITEGLLHPECQRIFRFKDDNPDGPVLQLHHHQREVIEATRTGSSYVPTTGTGSGKSLAYTVPIVNRVLAAKAAGTYQLGIKAIVVCTIDAPANSQLRELQIPGDRLPPRARRYGSTVTPGRSRQTTGRESSRIHPTFCSRGT